MSNALLVYDVILKQTSITFAVCNNFYEGAYLPDQRKIILCSNTIRDEEGFKDALKRQLIRMYDEERAVNYDS